MKVIANMYDGSSGDICISTGFDASVFFRQVPFIMRCDEPGIKKQVVEASIFKIFAQLRLIFFYRKLLFTQKPMPTFFILNCLRMNIGNNPLF